MAAQAVTAPRLNDVAGPLGLATQVIPVIHEQLEISRRVVETGHVVRVRKVVREDVVEVNEPLVTEHVDTERVAIGRSVPGPVAVRHEGDTMVIPVVEERLVLRKELFLVEEIRITRRRQSRPAGERVGVRRESVVVERFDPATQQWSVADGDGLGTQASGPGPPAAL